ncbi:MAG: AraC family transcriptional regulator [Bacteroidota bacterium]
MKTEFTLIGILLTVGVVQGLFLTIVLLLTKRGNVIANRLLALFILSFSLLTMGDILYETHLLLLYPHLLLVFDPLIFVLAPFCFLYVKALTIPCWKFKFLHILHFAPSILIYLFFSTIYIYDAKTKINLLIESYTHPDNSIETFLILAAIQIFLYLIINLKMIKTHATAIKNYYSYQESVSLRWLKYFLLINFILWMAFIISTFFNIRVLMDISNLLFTVAVYSIGYFGIKQPNIFFYDGVFVETDNQKTASRKKYISSTLTDQLVQKYTSDLIELMKNEKLYLQCDLKLVDVAEIMAVPQHHLSQIINENLGKNFNDFVNEFRVEEFKIRLSDKNYNNLTILAMGLGCGFNSKAALNSVFKKLTGFTPSEFKKMNSSR